MWMDTAARKTTSATGVRRARQKGGKPAPSALEATADLCLRSIGRIEGGRVFRILALDIEIVVLVGDLLLHLRDQQRLHELVVEIAEEDRRILVAFEFVLFEEADQLGRIGRLGLPDR